jgi:DNA-directed RNA polymerase subunit RPC12/RpoP
MFRRIMSEFKYACPWCGQHIKCDSSQSGTQMECPTCFQKIIVPQAPIGEQTFILSGQKVGNERPLPKTPEANPFTPGPAKRMPGFVVVLIILACIATAVGFVYLGTIFKRSKAIAPEQSSAVSPAAPEPAKAPSPKKQAPLLVAPPASDTNWTLDLKGIEIPDSTAAGRVEGHDFICQRAVFANGSLTLHDGDMSFAINFGGAKPEDLAGKSINVTTNTASAARINLHWKEGDEAMRESFTNGYAMHLDFGEAVKNRINGKIYLCTSDDKMSYVAGTFKASIAKPKPKTP